MVNNLILHFFDIHKVIVPHSYIIYATIYYSNVAGKNAIVLIILLSRCYISTQTLFNLFLYNAKLCKSFYYVTLP